MNRYIAFAAPAIPRESDDRPHPRFLEVLRRAMAELPAIEPDAPSGHAAPAACTGLAAAAFVTSEVLAVEPPTTLVTLRTAMSVPAAEAADSARAEGLGEIPCAVLPAGDGPVAESPVAESPDDDSPTLLPLEAAWMGWDSFEEPGPEPAAAEPEEVAPVAAAAAPPIRFDGFGTLDILDRFTEEELAELERYFLHTIGRCGPPHHPVRTARLLLRLSRKELELLGEWAERHFTGSAAA